MIKVDKMCHDILVKQILKSNTGVETKEEAEDAVQRMLSKNIPVIVSQVLSNELVYNFDVDKQVARILDDDTVVCLVEPILIYKNVGDDTEFSAVAHISKDEHFIKYLPFKPEKLEKLLVALERNAIKVKGFNGMQKKDAPTILLFSRNEEALDNAKQKLEDDYHAKTN